MEEKLSRHVDRLLIAPLFGNDAEFATINDAISFVIDFGSNDGSGVFKKFEISVVYSNGDRLDGSFATKKDAVSFLKYVGNGA